MNETATSFDEFFGAFDADAVGNQTEQSEETLEIDETTNAEAESDAETAQETEEASESGENAKDDTEGGEKKDAAESEQMSEMFTIKVNKEERQVTREELIALAQKGADYDRVKSQYDKGKTDNQALNDQLAKTQQVYDVIEQIAKETGVEIPKLLDTFQIRRLMDKEGLSEKEATERLGRLKAENQLKLIQESKQQTKSAEDERKERADREVKEFKENFPDIDISSLPVERMAKDIAAGMSMTQAYLKFQNQQQQEQIEKLNQQLKAQEQNKKNKASSPGSVSDSGTRKNKDQFDDFFSAFG
jgi:hypothetical protein